MNTLLVFSLRFLLLALLVVFNTVIIIVAAWNFCILQMGNTYRPIDVYLIFLGSFTVLFLLPIIFIDVVRKGAITSLVWFELTWVSILWVFQLAGAAALSATGDDPSCASDPSEALQNTCTSYRILLVFTWLAMSSLLILLVGLLTSVLAHNTKFPHVWTTGVRDFPWFENHHKAPSAAFLDHSGKTRIQPPPTRRYSSRHDQWASQPAAYDPYVSNSRRSAQPQYAFAAPDAAMGSGSYHPPAALTVEPMRREPSGPVAQPWVLNPPPRTRHRETQDPPSNPEAFYSEFMQSSVRPSVPVARASGSPTPAQLVMLEATKLSRTREERAAEFARQQADEVRARPAGPRTSTSPRSKPRPPRLII